VLRRKKKQQLPEPPFPPGDPRREMFLALAEYAQKGPRRKMRQVDDVLEFDPPGDVGDFATSLKQVIAHCKRMGIEVPKEQVFGLRKTGRPAAVEADMAAKKLREDMRKRGIRERKHYYSASERQGVGEIDRTHHVETDKETNGAE